MATSRTLHNGKRRYPGVHSFEDDEAHRSLFHGREQDAYELLQLIVAERLVVLFARSGIGKSSIINAGLMQPLRDKAFFPMIVRVSAFGGDPAESLYQGIEAACERAMTAGEVESYEPDPPHWNKSSLWHFFKSFYVWRENEDQPLDPVIIIDQFEELFTTISEASRRNFIADLADLAQGTRPLGRPSSADPEPELGDQAPRVKIVLSIREDFIAHLQEMAPHIPGIFKVRFRLGPLSREDAERAIVGPAELIRNDRETPPFTWSPRALRRTLDFLCTQIVSDGTTTAGNHVEPFQLQIVCQEVENRIYRRKITKVSDHDLGGEEGLRGTITDFYQDTLKNVCQEFRGFRLRRRLENLCEQELITSRGRRRLVEESTISQAVGVAPKILAKLVDHRLIRKEPRIGDNYYELSHDTLVAPILESRRVHERKSKRRLRLGSGAVALALFGTASVLTKTCADSKARDIAESHLAARLMEYGACWRELGNSALAAAFSEEATKLGGSIDGDQDGTQKRLPASPASCDEFSEHHHDGTGRQADGLLPQNGESTHNAEPKLDWLVADELERITERVKIQAARGDIDEALKLFRTTQERARAYVATDGLRESGDRPGAKKPRRDEDNVLTAAKERVKLTELLTGLLTIADLFAKAGYPEPARKLLDAIEKDYKDVVHARSWSHVCWFGALFGNEANLSRLKDDCDRAVDAIDTDDERSIRGSIYDSRGLVRVLTDEKKAAVHDFRKYLRWAKGPPRMRRLDEIRRREGWITALNKGQNPLQDEELEELRGMHSNVMLISRSRLLRISLPEDLVRTSLSALLEAWAEEPVILEQVAKNKPLCNAEPGVLELIEQCDQEWQRRNELAEKIESYPCSQRLKEIRDNLTMVDEIFATDLAGLNACQSNKTSDYYQADESWWHSAVFGTRRLRYEYDRSTRESSASVFVPIHSDGRRLGAMKAVFNLKHLSQGIGSISSD